MGLFDFLKGNNKGKEKSETKEKLKSKDISEDVIIVKGSTPESPPLFKTVIVPIVSLCKGKHDYRLFSVSGQLLTACSVCGKREVSRSVIDLSIAKLMKQD